MPGPVATLASAFTAQMNFRIVRLFTSICRTCLLPRRPAQPKLKRPQPIATAPCACSKKQTACANYCPLACSQNAFNGRAAHAITLTRVTIKLLPDGIIAELNRYSLHTSPRQTSKNRTCTYFGELLHHRQRPYSQRWEKGRWQCELAQAMALLVGSAPVTPVRLCASAFIPAVFPS